LQADIIGFSSIKKNKNIKKYKKKNIKNIKKEYNIFFLKKKIEKYFKILISVVTKTQTLTNTHTLHTLSLRK
jgi:hypothetical protein